VRVCEKKAKLPKKKIYIKEKKCSEANQLVAIKKENQPIKVFNCEPRPQVISVCISFY